jgi:enoyl-CoA hydratase/carnithine racemase
MDEIVTERSGSILRVQLNRPTKRNAMTSAMYLSLAHIFDKPAVSLAKVRASCRQKTECLGATT